MKLLQLTLTLGLCYLAVAQKCEPGSSSQVCCQQVTECNGICSDEHPEPGNEANWYSDSFCHEKSGCRCWKKGQCCELENRRCDYINGTCTLGKPPKDAYMQAVFPCDRKENCFCWQRKPCDQDNRQCKEKNGVCQHFPPSRGNWVESGYCDWFTDCKCWVKKEEDCDGDCPFKSDKCSRKIISKFWFSSDKKCSDDGCTCWRQCKPTQWCTGQKGRCRLKSPGSSYQAIGLCNKQGCYCWRQCQQDTACSGRQGKCLARHPGFSYEMIGICRQGCRCYRSCHDQQCVARGGKCSVKAPAFHTKIGQCKGNCSCWRKDEIDEIARRKD